MATSSLRIAIVHHDRESLMRLCVAATRNSFAVTATESADPLPAALDALRTRPQAMIIAAGEEAAAADAIISNARGNTKLLFLAPRSPHGAQAARMVRALGYAALQEDASSAVVMATVIALLAGTRVPDGRIPT